ncbi:MAG: NAD-glutamate dehydrogenase [Pseudomonadota bacterium]
MPAHKRRNIDRQQQLIESIIKATRDARPLKDRRQLRRFIGEYYRNVSFDDVSHAEPEALSAAALAHLRSARRRPQATHRLSVFNPTEKRDGWHSSHTVVQLVHTNMPFLVDSLTMTLDRLGYAIQLTIHPLVRCQRTEGGQLQQVLPRDADGGAVESFIRLDIPRETRKEKLEQIAAALEATLTDVRAAVRDWAKMRAKMREAADDIARRMSAQEPHATESEALLRWLAGERYTFLGYREYLLTDTDDGPMLKPRKRSALGVKSVAGRTGKAHPLSSAMRRFKRSDDLLLMTKARARATVHRNSYLDYVGVKLLDDNGKVIGERRFVGLLTSQAYSDQPKDIPLVRVKTEAVVKRAGVDPTGHRGKALMHILNNYPRDELFQASVSDLLRTTSGILNLQDRRRVKLFIRRDSYRHFYSCMVFIPREKYNTEVRHRAEQILTDALGASNVESSVQISDSALARVHLLVHVDASLNTKVSIRAIESAIRDAVVTWQDRLANALTEFAGEARGADLYDQYHSIFPLAYKEDTSAEQACLDINQIDQQLAGTADPLSAYQLHVGSNSNELTLNFRVFRVGSAIALSDALPLLENLGMRVINERPYQLRLGDTRVWLQDFELSATIDVPARELRRLAGHFAEGFAHQLTGVVESDGYNRLILGAGLTSRQAALIRAYTKYLLQLGLPFSQAYMEDMFAEHPGFISNVMKWFEERFDPAANTGKRRLSRLQQRVADSIADAGSLDADRTLRALHDAMQATRRCNYFWRAADHAPDATIAFKLATQELDEAPLPRPAHEIFVYSPRVEGVHLRAGDIARGGLRWSDRREDFRTEVLGLMKAQTVKNTVIVPTGAKGGFYPKQLPSGDRDEVFAEVTACYKIFINALLCLTDNIVDGQIVPPDGVTRLDGDDPYLVVAADKGTATFSDTANQIAIDRQFWLGDAFASGGSAGYDHKKMAITARGAWEAVKRHFRELGTDTQHDEFTVAGIGDMSGDVFGNGMLLSETIRLQAAFNHLHIFLDPEPNVSASFAERKRLFALPRSGWQDYDTKTLSPGGGVFSRSAKTVPLNPALRKLLKTDAETLSPPEVIKLILKMPVDLIWNGGIGTYVKAGDESHADVGDRHNNDVRVDAGQLNCKVIGEGGNLGLTQLARVEFSSNGGRINTDFIDNSAGVDSSDREVNIKILLRLAASHHNLKPKARNALLARMTDDVAELVLRNNYLQTQAISMMEARATERLSEHRELIDALERSGLLNRQLEFLPADDELDERKRSGRGLTRPEISVIVSYAKLDLYERLSRETLMLNASDAQDLKDYFPRALQKRYEDLIGQHQLGREIIVTLLTNSLVNRMGPVFATRAEQDTGFDVASVARSYISARDITGSRHIWHDIEKLDTRVPADIQYAMMFETARKLRHACYWILRAYDGQLDTEAVIEDLAIPVQDVLGNLGQWGSDTVKSRLKELTRRHTRMGVPERLAGRVSALSFVGDALEVVRVAQRRRCATDIIASVYFALGERLHIDWVREAIDKLQVDGRWQARARGKLRDNAMRAQRDLTGMVHSLNQCKASTESIDDLIESNRASVERVTQLIEQMRANDSRDFATLTVAVDELAQLTQA